MSGKTKTIAIAGMLVAPLMFVAAVCGNGNTTRIENSGDNQPHGITVAGEGKVSGKPDLALITLGVSTLRPTVAEAREAAGAALTGMIDSMKRNGVADKDIQTQQLSIYPEYDYTGSQQTLRGFRVSNTVSAKLRNIDNTSKVVDDAVAAGGNETTIQGIAFTIDNPESLRQQAREAAVADAKEKAKTLASASGVDVGNPIVISETGGYQPPIAYDRAAGAASAPEANASTPIQPGELDVVINVSVTWEIK
jgi:uncharacterized protein YggE